MSEQSKWIPTGDRLPDKWEDYLVIIDGEVLICSWNLHDNLWVDCSGFRIEATKPSYWQPLPEKPNQITDSEPHN